MLHVHSMAVPWFCWQALAQAEAIAGWHAWEVAVGALVAVEGLAGEAGKAGWHPLTVMGNRQAE